jgi:transcriptional regulator with XRE-family HTH domain
MGEIVPLRRTSTPTAPADGSEPLWRELVGTRLRDRRHERGERLVDVAERSGVSSQYLSEVERGLKDPSSEILSAVAGALGLSVREIAAGIAAELSAGRAAGPRAPLCLAA